MRQETLGVKKFGRIDVDIDWESEKSLGLRALVKETVESKREGQI
jgi:hypothetical protein